VNYLAAVLLLAAACGGDAYDPVIDPSRFVVGVDNPYFPLVPGTVFEYDVLETTEAVTVTVTSDTRQVMGVTCMVVHDVARSGGVVVEDTYDWYAQDDSGTVWYFGEDTTAFDGGATSKEGSWEGGVDGAKPGVIIPGAPRVGDVYRQEFLAGEAEDQGEVLALDATVAVPYGSFSGCLKTRDFTLLEPDVEENKFYCPSIGQVRAIATKGGAETEDLIAVTHP
jgi:hypothetical protein